MEFTVRSSVHLPQISPQGLKPLVRDALFVAEQESPIVTGRLRTGWYATERSLRNDVPYSGFVDAGTRYMEPRHMSRKTIDWMVANAARYVVD